MIISVVRKYFTEVSTIGKLSINGRFVCYTLEDKVRKRGEKVAGKTAIPKGRYPVSRHWSNKFNKWTPQINNVPGFDGILIHSGNTADDTEGCLLVGMRYADNKLLDSRTASKTVTDAIFSALDDDERVIIKFENHINKVKVGLLTGGIITTGLIIYFGNKQYQDV